MRVARLAIGPGPEGVRYATLEDATSAELWSAAPWGGGAATGERVAWTESMLRVPTAPSKILCVGRNYVAHARELGNEVPKEPLLFLKPPSSLLDHGGAIRLPPRTS